MSNRRRPQPARRPTPARRVPDPQAERDWALMIDIDGPTLDFSIERTGEAVGRDGFGTTFSMDAMEHLRDQMLMWVGTRVYLMAKEAEHAGTALPQKLNISLTVEPETGWHVLDSLLVHDDTPS